eukprot:scaffold169859_cov33-Tisochrysis_lutea.AAC.5
MFEHWPIRSADWLGMFDVTHHSYSQLNKTAMEHSLKVRFNTIISASGASRGRERSAHTRRTVTAVYHLPSAGNSAARRASQDGPDGVGCHSRQ